MCRETQAMAHGKADHFSGMSTPEFAVLGYLRTHPDIAKTYGMETCSPGCTGCKDGAAAV